MVSKCLKNVKVDFWSLSLRVFIFICAIMVSLLNAHLCFWLVTLTRNGKIENTTSYSRLKNKLNKESSFQKFLARFVDGWVSQGGDDPNVSDRTLRPRRPVVPREDTRDTRTSSLLSSIILKKRNRLKQFNDDPEAKRLRLSREVPHERISGAKKECLLCYRIGESNRKNATQTTVSCSICKVNLCVQVKTLPSGRKSRSSCWSKFHTMDKPQWFEIIRSAEDETQEDDENDD